MEQMEQMAAMIKQLGQMGNPTEYITKLAGQNPAINQIKALGDAANGDYKAAFFNAAKAKGLTDEQIQSGLQQCSVLFNKV